MSTSMQSTDMPSTSSLSSSSTITTRMKRFNQHDSEHRIKTKPPMVPMKRKKKLTETSVENLANNSATNQTETHKNNNNNKLKAKRQKIEDDSGKGLQGMTSTVKPTPVTPDVTVKITSKPPIPPKPDTLIMTQIMNVKQPKNKKKMEETNVAVVQKLNALAEKLRLENADLMKALSNEKLAVRTLRYV